MMRRILVEFARSRHRHKRGGDAQHVTLEGVPEISAGCGADLVALDAALFAGGGLIRA